MIAVLWAELTDWKEVESRRSLILLTLSLSVVFLITMARPDWCCVTLAANIIWLGLRAGRGVWSEVSPENWLIETQVKPWEVITGKIAAVLCLNMLQFMISLPIITALIVLWGIPWPVFINFGLLGLGASVIAALLPISCNKIGEFGDLLAIGVLGGWLIVTLMIDKLTAYNPLIQVYLLLQGQSIEGYRWFGIYLVLAALLTMLAVGQLRKEVRPQ